MSYLCCAKLKQGERGRNDVAADKLSLIGDDDIDVIDGIACGGAAGGFLWRTVGHDGWHTWQ